MSKRRKTRQEKIISDLRRKLVSQPTSSLPEKTSPITSTSGPPKIILPEKPQLVSAINDYSYLARDLRKIAILTGLAISFQAVLYLALRQ